MGVCVCTRARALSPLCRSGVESHSRNIEHYELKRIQPEVPYMINNTL